MSPRTFTPDPAAIYLGDNGRALCGAHLGAMASTTGRDISGQPLHRLTPRDVAEMDRWLKSIGHPKGSSIACETCGKPASRLHTTTTGI